MTAETLISPGLRISCALYIKRPNRRSVASFWACNIKVYEDDEVNILGTL